MPHSRLLFRRLSRDLVPEKTPHRTLDVTGYGFESTESEIELPGGFKDINGDGRPDLITVTIDVGVAKVLGSLATKRLTVGLDFTSGARRRTASSVPSRVWTSPAPSRST